MELTLIVENGLVKWVEIDREGNVKQPPENKPIEPDFIETGEL